MVALAVAAALNVALSRPMLAWSCTAGDAPAMATTPGCVHGAPARSGDTLLIPRICRTSLQGKTFDRHTVDIRNATTGARVGQASLPPSEPKAGAPLAQVAQILGGPWPLLVHPGGIGAVDAKASRIEAVFESDSGLNAVARLGDVLTIVEKMLPDKQFPKGGLEWTVLDYGAGEMLGQLQLAGGPAEAVALKATTGGGIEAALYRSVAGKRFALIAQVIDSAGKHAADAAMRAKVVEVPGLSRPPAAAGCAVLATAAAIRVDVLGFSTSDDPARNAPAVASAGHASVTSASTCLAILEPDTRGDTFGWFAAAGGKAELRAVHCRNP